MSPWENYHLEWSPDPLTVAIPSWQDITGYALAPFGAPIHIQTGIPVMGSGAQPATMAVSLDNRDHRFTFGNVSSPLSPNWKPGRRIRCYEVIGNRRFDVFSGYIQPPETDDWAESGVDQYMAVVAVDRLGRLGVARAMVSTLAEHIIYNGGPSLVGYWPLLESTPAPFAPGPTTPQSNFLVADQPPSTSILVRGNASTRALPGGGIPVPGDDKGSLRLVPTISGSVYFYWAQLYTTLNPTITLTSGNTLTLSMWVYPEDPLPAENLFVSALVSFGGTSQDGFQLQRASGVWQSGNFLGAASPSIAFPGLIPNTWNYVAQRMSLPSGLCEVWVNGATSGFTTTIGSPPASSQPMDTIYISGPLQGNVAHMQLYNGSGYTAAFHLAQYQMGLNGLYGQTPGQRIRTLANYAGIPTAELSNVDDGITPMQKATLAGQSPLAEMRVAEATEQGRLRTNGQGLLVFDSRLRRYNS